MFYLRVFLVFFAALITCSIGLVFNLLTFWSPNRFYYSVRALSISSLWILGIKVEHSDMHYLEGAHPIIVVGNHQSFLDAVTFGSLTPKRMVVIGKKELRYIPIIGQWLWSTGSVFIDRKNRTKAINQMDTVVKAILKRGISIGILPEGTRNLKGSGLLPFKKGAFHLAIATQSPIVIAMSSPLAEIANFDKRLLRRGIIQMKAFPPIETKGLTEADVDSLMEKVRNEMLKGLSTLETKLL